MFDSFVVDYSVLRNVIDVLLVACIIYGVLSLLKGTRSSAMSIGLFFVLGLYVASRELGLLTVSWILGSVLESIILLVVVLFQEEIRKALTKFGAPSLFRHPGKADVEDVIKSVSLAARKLSKAKLGALIVIQRDVGLDDFIEDSVELDAMLSRKLLYGIFVKDSPLHDGAVIISGDRIRAAGCVLPLSYSASLDPSLGTRHRAALGLSEKSDAVIVVVSEETSAISIAREGTLYRNLDGEALVEELRQLLPLSEVYDHDEETGMVA